MAETTVGSVGLDLVLNSKEFKTQLKDSVNNAVGVSTKGMENGLKSAAGSLAKIAGAVFIVKKVAEFGAACVELGSDLTEVQNVVDTAFGSMSYKIEDFAKSSIKNYGLSELAAKQMASTYMAMSTGMGQASNAASDMAVNITGRMGDIMSFYNKTAGEAETIGNAIYTAETEPLKRIGVVMTQANLKTYALQQGYSKLYTEMSSGEQLLIRQRFFLEKTNLAAGDFVKTSGSWANQTRVLGLQFQSLQAQLGQAFIQVLTPVIRVINELMGRLVALATTFNKVTASIFGKQETSGAGAVAQSVADIGTSATDSAKSTAAAAKKIAKSLLGIDQINKLNDNSDAGSGSGSDAPSISAVDTSTANKGLSDTDNKLKNILGKFTLINEMGNAFKTGFLDGINGVDFGHIVDGLDSIKTSLKDVFNGTKGSFSNMIFDWAGMVGRELGSFVKIGTGIADAIITGVSFYLIKKKTKLIKTLNTIFDNLGTYFEKAGSISVTIADLLYGFFTDGAMNRAVANCISILADLVLEPAELISKFLADSFTEIDTYLTNMSPLISTTLSNIASVFESVSGTVATVVSDTFETIGTTYDTYVRPALTNFREGFEKISTTVLEGWNNYIYPVIQDLITEFNRVYTVALKPLIDQIATFVGKIILLASQIYNRFIAPLINWFVSKLYPNIASTIKLIGNVIGTLVEAVAGVAEGVLQSLGGIIDFLTGVFTGDWEKAWGGLKDIVVGIWDTLSSVLKAPINLLIDGLNLVIDGLNKISIDIPEWVPGGAKSFGVNIDNIPKLAQGGYVGVNSPTLAMIGDNRHTGEHVVPDTKLAETVATQIAPVLTAINSLVTALANNNSGDSGNITIPVIIGGTIIDNIVVTAQQRQKMRSGGR